LGVKINELVKEVKKVVTFENLLNKKIAIDAFNTLYQFLAIIRQRDGTPLKDFEGNITSHLSGLFYRTINFLENDIKPIYVYDGKPSSLKLDIIKERKDRKVEAKVKMEEAKKKGDIVGVRKFAQATSRLDSNMIKESMDLLDYMGIPVVQAPSEGEAQIAYMVNQGDVWASASQDYDTLLFGAKKLLRNFAINRTRKVGDTSVSLDIEWILLPKLLEKLDITQEQLIEMGILIGTDFFEGVEGIGQKTAFDLITKYKSIKKINENSLKVRGKIIDLDIEVIEKVKNIFLNPSVEKNYQSLKWKKPNFDKIEEFLIGKHNFSEGRVKNALDRLKKKESESMQTSLDRFFK